MATKLLVDDVTPAQRGTNPVGPVRKGMPADDTEDVRREFLSHPYDPDAKPTPLQERMQSGGA